MKVLMVTGSYPPMKCGVGDYTHRLVQALNRIPSLKMKVLTSRLSGFDSKSESEVLAKMTWGWRDIFIFIKILFTVKPNIIHWQFPTQGYRGKKAPYFLVLLGFLLRFKIVQTWHEFYEPRQSIYLFPKFLVSGGLIYVRSNYLELYPKKLQWVFKNKNIKYIRNGSNIPKSALGIEERAILKKRLLEGKSRLIFNFGYIAPYKGLELLFEIANPTTDRLIISGRLGECDPNYLKKLESLASRHEWKDQKVLVGYLDDEQVANYLSVSDAVVFPLVDGSGDWNTSIHAARYNGAFVIATSKVRQGFVPNENTYYAPIGDVAEMRKGLAYAKELCGSRREFGDSWFEIAEEHYKLYRQVLDE